jgi:GNAT superfamily N-acetyltransferase
MTEPVAFACGMFQARSLTRDEIPEMQRFYEANPRYFEIVEGGPAAKDAAQADFDQMPPPEWPCGGKHVIAFRDREGRIVGAANLLHDVFAPGVWIVGLFLTAERLHGTGVPHALYAHMEAWMRSRGARWLRLGVVRDNVRGARFWEKVGYVDVARREGYVLGPKSHTLRVMAKPLAGGTLEEYRALVPRDNPELAPT